MRIGISELFTGADGRDGPWMVDAGRLLDDIGFDSVWVPERHAWPPAYRASHPYGAQPEMETLRRTGQFEALTSLAALAVATRHIRLGTYVTLPAFRHPLVLAREFATIDQVSQGRLNVGVGVSWLEEEYEAFGLRYADRGRQVTEHMAAVKAIWTQDPVEFHGSFVDFDPVFVGPKPLQSPHPPIWVGGNSPATIRRLVALGDRWLGYNLPIHDAEMFIEKLRRALEEAGRDADSVGLAMGCRLTNVHGVTTRREVDRQAWKENAAYIDRCRAIGISEVVISTRMPTDGYEDNMRDYAECIGVARAT
jgi:probable F420-dependent oxidoreductase